MNCIGKQCAQWCAIFVTFMYWFWMFSVYSFCYINSVILVVFCRYTPSMSRRQLFPEQQPEQCLENDNIYFVERGDSFNCSNFLDVDWLSSSGNSCEEETYERYTFVWSNAPNLLLNFYHQSDDYVVGTHLNSHIMLRDLYFTMHLFSY